MIIVLGPDDAGKTTLVVELATLTGMETSHHTMDSTYQGYLDPLVSTKAQTMIMDRYMFCEVPYAFVLNRKFKYPLKHFHNIVLLTLMYNPLIILCTHKPVNDQHYDKSVLPYERWDECLGAYRRFLQSNHIPYLVYDYGVFPEGAASAFRRMEKIRREEVQWWLLLWQAGYGPIGSPHPDILIVAERLGPNNVHNLPFETGPTGYMMTEMLDHTSTPLGRVAITNLVKAPRGDKREPNDEDLRLLKYEIDHMKPKGVLLMGSTAKAASPMIQKLELPWDRIPHLGYYHHRGIKDMTGYHKEWQRIYRRLCGETEPSWTIHVY